MSTDLILKRTATGVMIDRENVARALAEISTADGLTCSLDPSAHGILVSVSLPRGDARSAGITVSFQEEGSELTGSARAGGGPLLSWCLHALAARLDCRLFDPQTGGSPKPNSQRYLAEAKAQVVALEKEILADEPHVEADEEEENEESSAAPLLVGFLRSLVAAEQLSLTGDASELAELAPKLSDPSELYEALLDSPLVDDVFLSESELIHALTKYRRRAVS